MPDYNEFFTLIGQLNTEDESSFRYYPLFLKKREIDFKKIMETESEMFAVLLDESGENVLKVPLSYGYYCNDEEKLPQFAVRGYIPLDKRTRTILFEYQKNTIAEFQVPLSKPQIKSISKIPKQIREESLELSWNAVYEGDADLQFKVFYSNNGGKSWQRIGNRTTEQKMNINVADLVGGKNCRFAVEVTDGYNNSRIETNEFTVENKPNEAIILSPTDETSLFSKRDILLNGQGYNPNTGQEITKGISWFSSVDGNLGKGSIVQTRLSKGNHIISLHIGKSVSTVNVKVE